MELLKIFMARSGVADKLTMVTRGDMEWPGKGAHDACMTTCHKKANLQRFNISWVPQPKDKHGTCCKMF